LTVGTSALRHFNSRSRPFNHLLRLANCTCSRSKKNTTATTNLRHEFAVYILPPYKHQNPPITQVFPAKSSPTGLLPTVSLRDLSRPLHPLKPSTFPERCCTPYRSTGVDCRLNSSYPICPVLLLPPVPIVVCRSILMLTSTWLLLRQALSFQAIMSVADDDTGHRHHSPYEPSPARSAIPQEYPENHQTSSLINKPSISGTRRRSPPVSAVAARPNSSNHHPIHGEDKTEHPTPQYDGEVFSSRVWSTSLPPSRDFPSFFFFFSPPSSGLCRLGESCQNKKG